MRQRIVCRAPVRVSPGTRLARAVTRPDGVVLLAAGSELDAEKLAHLYQRGVEVIFVWEDDPRDDQQVARDIAAVEERLAHMFRPSAEAMANPASGESREELRRAVLNYRQAAQQAGRGSP